MEKELTAAVTTQEPMLADRLIVVQQLPVIKEQLHSIKAQAQASVAEALALVCTEETLKAVKDRRAALTRDRKDLDARRMVVKNQIMQPFEDFDKVYKECVTDVYGPADEALKGKITDVEAGLKADKEKKVVAYFDELVKANGVEWVSYEDIGIAVTMTASLKSLKSKVKEYVDRVVADVNCINGMENINGFQKTLYWTADQMMSHADKYSPAFSAAAYKKLMNGEIPQNELWKYSSFWYKDFDGMAKKTMLRQLISKWGIMTAEMTMAYERDGHVMMPDTASGDLLPEVTDTPEFGQQDEQEQPKIERTAKTMDLPEPEADEVKAAVDLAAL